MKPFVIFGIVIISLLSCRKDPNINIQQPISEEKDTFNLVVKEGSWWKYDWYSVDSLGNETLTAEKDCLYVVGDTLINGNIYTHFTGDYHILSSYDWFWRDSLHYIVNSNGQKLFSTVTAIDTLETISGTEDTKYIITDGIQNQMTVPAGIFPVFDSQLHYRKTDNSPYTSCSPVWIKHTRFANGIGMISSQTGYITQIQLGCGYTESRLTDYHIAE